jgi:eukaryotic-like serine/threonine-protein kinase
MMRERPILRMSMSPGDQIVSLTPEQWKAVAAEFDRLHDSPDEIRRAALAELGAADAEVARELDALFDAVDRTDSRLDRSALDAFVQMNASAPSLTGRTLGAYRVTRVIGRGGMGVVFEGQHTDPQVAKRVAIKTLAIGVERPERLWRFRRERQILAGLDHPNIGALYDGGTTDDGVPYLVMEYVDGERIDVWCETHRLTVPQRIDLFRQVCAAVQFAHSKLVVHRDLKPSNIFVTADGVVKLLDFGIAKLLTPDDARDETTRGGIAPLTTAYASPEQARGEEITTAADVYSLGIVLYRLLTGSAPYDIDGRSPAEVLRILSTQPPRLPSEDVTDDHARSCGVSDARPLRATLSGELDAIVLMALRKEPERRYASVEALSADLLRYLRGRPVQARPDTLGYRVRKFVAREKALVAGVAVAALALVGGSVMSMRAANVAREEAVRSQRMTRYLQAIVGSADQSWWGLFRGGKDVTLREAIDSVRMRVATELPDDPRTRADLYFTLGNSYRTFNRLDVALTLFDSARVLHSRSISPTAYEVARDIESYGNMLQEAGKIDSAEAAFRDALARYQVMPTPPDSDITHCLVALGQILVVHQSKVDAGMPILLDAVARERARAKPRWSLLAIAENSLAGGYILNGKAAASDSAFERASDALARDSARTGSDRGLLLINWGSSVGRRGEFARAADLKRRGLTIVYSTLGPTHYVAAVAQSRLADELVHLNRVQEGRGLVDSALAVHESLQPRSHVEISYSLRLLAAYQLAAGERQAAAQTISRASALLDSVKAGRPALETNLLLVTADLHLANGKPGEARAAVERAAALAREKLGPKHLLTAQTARRLASMQDGGASIAAEPAAAAQR